LKRGLILHCKVDRLAFLGVAFQWRMFEYWLLMHVGSNLDSLVELDSVSAESSCHLYIGWMWVIW
jgi:hypothetical protein